MSPEPTSTFELAPSISIWALITVTFRLFVTTRESNSARSVAVRVISPWVPLWARLVVFWAGVRKSSPTVMSRSPVAL